MMWTSFIIPALTLLPSGFSLAICQLVGKQMLIPAMHAWSAALGAEEL